MLLEPLLKSAEQGAYIIIRHRRNVLHEILLFVYVCTLEKKYDRL